MEGSSVYGGYKGTPLLTLAKSFMDTKYITALKKDLVAIVGNLERAQSSSTGAVVPERRKTRAETYVGPPKPILPTTPTPAEKRDSTKNEVLRT